MKSCFFKSICSWAVPFLREHEVHTATQQSHEDVTGNQGSLHRFHAIKTITAVTVLGAHHIQTVKMARTQVQKKTFYSLYKNTHRHAVYTDIYTQTHTIYTTIYLYSK